MAEAAWPHRGAPKTEHLAVPYAFLLADRILTEATVGKDRLQLRVQQIQPIMIGRHCKKLMAVIVEHEAVDYIPVAIVSKETARSQGWPVTPKVCPPARPHLLKVPQPPKFCCKD